jgi:hypothetical protein
MDRDQYFVVLHKGEWKIKHNGRHSHPLRLKLMPSVAPSRPLTPRTRMVVCPKCRTEWTYGTHIRRKAKERKSLASDESQQVGIDGIGLGGRHAVRKAPIGFQGAVLQ